MEFLIIGVFATGYILIALEHPLKVNKTATAILTGVICWMLFMFIAPDAALLESQAFNNFRELISIEHASDEVASLGKDELHREFVIHELAEHLASISQILFFLLGAMTIVELVDAHRGFRFI